MIKNTIKAASKRASKSFLMLFLAQSKMADRKFPKDEKPLLKKWGKIVTSRIFAVNSFVNVNTKESLLQVMEAIRYILVVSCWTTFASRN